MALQITNIDKSATTLTFTLTNESSSTGAVTKVIIYKSIPLIDGYEFDTNIEKGGSKTFTIDSLTPATAYYGKVVYYTVNGSSTDESEVSFSTATSKFTLEYSQTYYTYKSLCYNYALPSDRVKWLEFHVVSTSPEMSDDDHKVDKTITVSDMTLTTITFSDLRPTDIPGIALDFTIKVTGFDIDGGPILYTEMMGTIKKIDAPNVTKLIYTNKKAYMEWEKDKNARSCNYRWTNWGGTYLNTTNNYASTDEDGYYNQIKGKSPIYPSVYAIDYDGYTSEVTNLTSYIRETPFLIPKKVDGKIKYYQLWYKTNNKLYRKFKLYMKQDSILKKILNLATKL